MWRGSFLILLVLFPLRLIAEGINPEESVVFKLSINGQSWGQLSVLCVPQECYVNLPELLTQMEYAYYSQPEAHRFKGYLSSEGDFYEICNDTLQLSSGGVQSVSDIAWGEQDELFIKASLINKLYGVQLNFNMSSLALNVVTLKPIPAQLRQERETRKQKMMKEREQNTLTNIDTLKRRNLRINSIGYNISPFFSFGKSTNWQLRGNINGELLRGSFLANYNYSSINNQDWNKNFTFGWNRPIESKLVKNINVYHDYSNLITTTRGYSTAFSLTNEHRSSYLNRIYAYQGKTTPDTEVEVYNNGNLVQYVRSDSLGHYSVDIPTYGGNNKIVAVSYDAFGLPLSSEELIYLPPDMQPKGALGYSLTGGYTDDGAFFITPMFIYGLTRWATLSAGNETVFHRNRTTSIAVMGVKLSMLKRMRLDLNYVPTVKWDATFSTNIGRHLNGNIFYERYHSGQNVVEYAPEQRFTVNLNGDLPFRKLRGNYFISALYYKYPFAESFSIYIGAYFWWRKLLTNVSVSSNSNCMKIENIVYTARVAYTFSDRWYNELQAEYRSFRSEFLLRDRVNYQFKNRLTAFVESEYNFRSNRYNVSLGITWRMPYVQIKSGLYNSNNFTSAYAGASGSAIFLDRKVAFSERYVAGASLLVALYVDQNGNRAYDRGEPIFKEANVLIHTAAEEHKTDRGVLFTDIPSGVPFKLSIPSQRFPDITWQIETCSKNLVLSPYQSRSFYIPIHVFSEVSGQVYTMRGGQKIGIGGVTVVITCMEDGQSIRTRCDEWGYYDHMGLTCGKYNITLDTNELKSRKLTLTNDKPHQIDLLPSLEGVQLDQLDFQLQSKDQHT